LAGKLALNGKLLSTLVAVGAAALLVLGPTTPAQADWWPEPWAGPGFAPWSPPPPIGWGAPLLATAWAAPPPASLDAPPTSSTSSLAGWPAAAIPAPLADPLGSQFRGTWLQAQFLQALNRGDAAAAAVYLADDAVYSISDGVGLCGPLPCVGRPAIQPELDRQVSIHVSYLPVGLDTSSNTVTGRFAITTDNITAAGAQRVLGTVTSETRTDKLSYVRLSLERDDPQTAQFLAWAMRQPPGVATAPAATGPAPAGGAPAPAAGTAPTGGAAAPATGTAPAGGATAPTTAAPTAVAPGAVANGTATLAASLNSGVTGTATLAQSGETTNVTVTLSGMAANSAHAGHIHRGSCSGAIIFPLGVVTADASGQGSVTATVNASIDAASWWIQFHTSDNPPGPPIACGPVALRS
jgi:CHRD domain